MAREIVLETGEAVKECRVRTRATYTCSCVYVLRGVGERRGGGGETNICKGVGRKQGMVGARACTRGWVHAWSYGLVRRGSVRGQESEDQRGEAVCDGAGLRTAEGGAGTDKQGRQGERGVGACRTPGEEEPRRC